ncbi:Eco57I restriction-modification methylase domain-containing protein [Nonomuraea sp. 10N515B]|uniref:Eco57I restriction-modification methylase domain-containing protein n=1 Tax=Nonomuraea sp. 10N515B TaxID=3457422 RepID=UPI003FCED474
MKSGYLAVDVQGSLLPQDVLSRIAAADRELPGMRPEDYHLAASERLGDAASRHWDYLLGAYRAFRDRLAALPESDAATTLTRERWLLILFQELGFGRVPFSHGSLKAGGKEFPISHLWHSVPMHLLGWKTDLDRSVPGVIKQAPQSMLQEFLNLSNDNLWAVLSNGRQLRILRDSTALVGSAYVEFDLEAIFEGELYSEFALLYTLMHASRFELIAPDEGAATCADCWLEKWRAFAAETGIRARDQLRDGLKEAMEALGTGFLLSNPKLREQLESGRLTREDFHHELLRLAYQLIFIFVAEDRSALLDPNAQAKVRDRYNTWFSSRRLRRLAVRRAGDRHKDLWKTAVMVIKALGADEGLPELGLPGLGGLFFRTADSPSELGDHPFPDQLVWCDLPNENFLTAVRKMSTVRAKDGRPRDVDFQHLGAEELGSVYESLLELVPYATSNGNPRFELREKVSGNDRKLTGSYYTPSSLVESLLNTALEPVIDEHAPSGDPDELLRITVCDPACGSGAFLIGAARRIAKRYAAMVTGEDEPVPSEVRKAMRRVVARCIYGVDLNPLAVELAKVSLWIESLEPGKPLAFLDSHLKVGNALIGATPKLIEAGVPEGAFKALEGDSKSVVVDLKKANKQALHGTVGRGSGRSAAGMDSLFDDNDVVGLKEALEQQARSHADVPVLSVADVREQERRFREYDQSPELFHRRLVADTWCAAFVWRKHENAPPAITTATVRSLQRGGSLAPAQMKELRRLVEQYQFFHWHLEFPEIFRTKGTGMSSSTGWDGGFKCVLGNPPWERIAFDDDEFFDSRAPEILAADTTAKRKARIEKAIQEDESLRRDYYRERRSRAEVTHFISSSGLYELTTAGRLTTQGPFAETTLRLLSKAGRAGIIIPTTVLTAVPMKIFWEWLRRNRRVRGILDMENSRGIFPSVHRSTKFTLLTLAGRSASNEQDTLRMGVFLVSEEELRNPDRVYEFPLNVLEELNPITRQLPICRTRRDVDLLISMSRHSHPHLGVKPWNGFTSEGHSHLYLDSPTASSVALYEGKMIHQFDSCYATYAAVDAEQRSAGKPRKVTRDEKFMGVEPRFWAEVNLVGDFLARKGESKSWICVVRRYVRATDEHTAIAALVPRTVPIQPLNGFSVDGAAEGQAWALACINSFAYDFMAKQKTPGQDFNVTIMSQVPIPTPREAFVDKVVSSVLELSYTSWHLETWATTLSDCNAPFIWDEERRDLIRAELDAIFFHLYGLHRSDVDYIMNAFPIVKRKDEAKYGEYRTKRLILEAYDAVQDAIEGRKPYQTRLNPPPGHGPRHPSP